MSDLNNIEKQLRLAFETKTDETRRLFHGRGRCYPGLEFLTIDFFPPVVFVVLYQQQPQAWLDGVQELLLELLGERMECLLLQRRDLAGAPTEVLHGAIPEPCFAREAGLKYRLRLGQAQNIGFFPDMARGRELARHLAAGRKVLNLFAYTCSFSVAALAGGAREVVNLDMNRGALQLGRQNHLDNDLDPHKARFLPHDLFKSFGKLKKLGPYDLVIVDPPTSQGQSFTAERDWPKLARRLPTLTAPAGDIFACLSAPYLGPDFLIELFAEHAPEAKLIQTLGPPENFPETDPDAGLNILHFRMQTR